MNRKNLQLLLVSLVIYFTYIVIIVLTRKVLNLAFWLSLGFITLSYAFVVISLFFIASEKRNKQVVGMPLSTLSIMYCVLEFIAGTVLMCIPNLIFSVVFIPQFVLLMLFLICFIPAILSTKNYK